MPVLIRPTLNAFTLSFIHSFIQFTNTCWALLVVQKVPAMDNIGVQSHMQGLSVRDVFWGPAAELAICI